MAITKPKNEQRSLTRPLVIVAVVLLIVGSIMFVVRKGQAKDPTLTAAPATGDPGQTYQASPDKLAKEQDIVARRKADIEAFHAAPGAGKN